MCICDTNLVVSYILRVANIGVGTFLLVKILQLNKKLKKDCEDYYDDDYNPFADFDLDEIMEECRK